MRTIDAELLNHSETMTLGEGPCWDSRSSTFMFVDIMESRVYEMSSDGTIINRFEMPSHVAAVLPSDSGGWLVALQDSMQELIRDGACTVVLDMEHNDSIRFNDAKCDPRGRLFAGTMGYDFRAGAGDLLRFDAGPYGLQAVPVIESTTISNGLGWSPDATTMYFIDSATQCVLAIDYDADSGSLTTLREFVRFDDREGMPDGLCVDGDGGVWVALMMSSSVRRFTPQGRVDTIIHLPVRRPTSCAFGGPTGNQLLITTSSFMMDERERKEFPLSGSLFSVELDVSAPAATLWDSSVSNKKMM